MAWRLNKVQVDEWQYCLQNCQGRKASSQLFGEEEKQERRKEREGNQTLGRLANRKDLFYKPSLWEFGLWFIDCLVFGLITRSLSWLVIGYQLRYMPFSAEEKSCQGARRLTPAALCCAVLL